MLLIVQMLPSHPDIIPCEVDFNLVGMFLLHHVTVTIMMMTAYIFEVLEEIPLF